LYPARPFGLRQIDDPAADRRAWNSQLRRDSDNGERVEHLPPRDRDIAFVFQSYALYPHMSVFENLAFSLKLRGVPAGEIAGQESTEAARCWR
jgi:ABC-type sulfate/molybdate transport systems ATPase subunit